MMTTQFAEAYKRSGDPDWHWKIYHYADDTPDAREIITHRSKEGFATPNSALDAASEYLEENNIEAELCF